jgi:hypothetical protein
LYPDRKIVRLFASFLGINCVFFGTFGTI